MEFRTTLTKSSMFLDILFVIHAIFNLFSGLICLFIPHALDLFLAENTDLNVDDPNPATISTEQPLTIPPPTTNQSNFTALDSQVHTFIRLYGVMMLVQAYQVSLYSCFYLSYFFFFVIKVAGIVLIYKHDCNNRFGEQD